MGLFRKKPIFCALCGKEVKEIFEEVRVENGIICRSCAKSPGIVDFFGKLDTMTLEELRGIAQANETGRDVRKAQVEALACDVKLDGFLIHTQAKQWSYSLSVGDETGEAFVIPSYTIFSFDDIEEIWSASGSVSYHKDAKRGVMKRAVVGTVLAGSAGAVIGAATAREDKKFVTRQEYTLCMRLRQYPGKTLVFPVKSARNADELCDTLTGKTAAAAQSAVDPIAELRKYKALLDDGIITQEDFNAKKKQLLGL